MQFQHAAVQIQFQALNALKRRTQEPPSECRFADQGQNLDQPAQFPLNE
jgi:hypothetical protein